MAQQVGNIIFQISADLKNIQGQLRTMEGNFQTSFNKVQSIAGGVTEALGVLGFGLSIGAIVGFSKSVVNAAGHLTDLADQTGISAQLLSGMKAELEAAGTSVDAFAKGIFTAQKNLGQIKTETDEAARAAKRLGLNLDELRNASPEKFFELVSNALAKVTNLQQRNADGAALLGRAYQELGPGIAAVSGRLEELRQRGITEADLKLLDEAGDAWTRLSNRVQIAAATIFTDAIRTFDTIRRLAALQDILKSGAGRAGVIGALSGFGSAEIGEALEGALKPAQKANPFQAFGDPAAAKKAAEEARKLQEEHFKGIVELLEEQEKKSVEAGKAIIGVFTEMRELGLTPAERGLSEINKRFDELIAKISEAGAATRQNFGPQLERLNELRQQSLLRARFDQPGSFAPFGDTRALAENFASLQASLNALSIEGHNVDQTFLALGDRFDRTSRQIDIQRRRIELLIEKFGPLSDEVGKAVDELDRLQAQQDLTDVFRNITASIGRGIDDTLRGINEGTQTITEGLNNMFRNVLLSINVAVAQELIVKPITDVANAFFEGFAEAFAEAGDNAAKRIAKDLGQSLGKWLREAFSGGGGGGGGFDLSAIFGGFDLSAIFGSIGSWFSGLFPFHEGGLVSPGQPRIAFARFHSGGEVPAMLERGEFVFQQSTVARMGVGNLSYMNQTGQMPSGQTAPPTVIINGDITPRQPNMTRDQVISIVMHDFDNRGPLMATMEQRRSGR